jgi:hypothetical protein
LIKVCTFAGLALLGSCSHRTVSPPAPIIVTGQAAPSDAKAGKLVDDAASKVSASVRAAEHANALSAESPAKSAVAGELSVAHAILPEPSATDAGEALERVNAALRGDLVKAQTGWQAAAGEAAKLRADLTSTQAAAQRERDEAAAQLNARESLWSAKFTEIQKQADERVASAKAAAEAEQRHLLNIIFHGGGAILVLAGIACLTVLLSLPLAGPKVGCGLIAAGAFSISAGIAVNWMLAHPWVPIVGVCVPLFAALALAYSNHWHAKTQVIKSP